MVKWLQPTIPAEEMIPLADGRLWESKEWKGNEPRRCKHVVAWAGGQRAYVAVFVENDEGIESRENALRHVNEACDFFEKEGRWPDEK